MEIGLFQLENLILTRTGFTFLDLRKAPAPHASPDLQAILDKAVRVPGAAAAEHLRERRIPPSAPVVLLCEDGQVSGQVARGLESAGYQNVYVVVRGELGLLTEL